MAKAKDSSEKPTITRVKAQDDRSVTKKRPQAVTTKSVVTNGEIAEPKSSFFSRFIGYFKGAWFELKQVRWPSRRATLGMTAALLIFTTIFIVFIVAIDLLWENLFKLILS